jgi:hypothetical protein
MKRELIDFAKGRDFSDNRSIVYFVGRDSSGNLFTYNESFADAVATNGKKEIVFKQAGVEISPAEMATLSKKVLQKLQHDN